MKLCYFGTYEAKYPRNQNVILGLRLKGVQVVELHESLFDGIENKFSITFGNKLKIFFNLIFCYFKLIWRRLSLSKVDCVVVGYPGQLDMILARILFPTKKIIFNPMISLYDTMINDRKISDNYLIKKAVYSLDKISCLLANKIVLDTPEHAKYFCKQFKVPESKLSFVYIGADDKIFTPINSVNNNKKFEVLFYGKFTPIHGIKYIIRAVNILRNKDVHFTIVGTGQVHSKIIGLAKELNIEHKITFLDWVEFYKLPQKIAKADICLGGHFGKSDKACRVVSNKTFQMIAMAKPVIVADSSASRSAGFVDKENAMMCPVGDSQALADIILKLKVDKKLRDRISCGALELFKNNFLIEKTSEDFKNIIDELVKRKTWHDSSSYRFRKKIIFDDVISEMPLTKSFLEIGVGGGSFCLDLVKMGFSGQGIDVSEDAVTIARLRTADFSKQILIQHQDIMQKTGDAKYDMIFAFEVLEHIKDDRSTIAKIHSLINNGGYFIFSVPAHKKEWSILDEGAGHFRRYERREIEQMMESAGFLIERIYSYGFPLVNILRFIRKRIAKWESASSDKQHNTNKSGIDRGIAGKFFFLFNDFVLLPFYFLQRIFINSDLSHCYLVVAKK